MDKNDRRIASDGHAAGERTVERGSHGDLGRMQLQVGQGHSQRARHEGNGHVDLADGAARRVHGGRGAGAGGQRSRGPTAGGSEARSRGAGGDHGGGRGAGGSHRADAHQGPGDGGDLGRGNGLVRSKGRGRSQEKGGDDSSNLHDCGRNRGCRSSSLEKVDW